MDYTQSIYLKSDLKVTFSYVKIHSGGLMEIVNFKKTKANIYEITIKDGTSKMQYEIYDDIILKNDLLIDKKLTKTKLNNILKENEIITCYYEALKYLSRKMRTKKEIRTFLKRKDYSDYSIEKSIDRLVKEGYLDELKYVSSYINDSLILTLDGPLKIKSSLLNLGIKEKTIDDELSKIDTSIFKEKLIKIIEKKKKTNKYSNIIFKAKLKSYLTMNGYEDDMIMSMLDSIHIDSSEIFEKEANKIWNVLSKKYQNKELKVRFKNKMYTKGFSIDEINKYIDKYY